MPVMDQAMSVVDTSFNFKTDTPPGQDPDKASPTLHRYHRALWGRTLPNGRPFDLEDARPIGYLRHRNPSGPDIWLSSDAVIPTFLEWTRPAIKRVTSQVAEADRRDFYFMSYTIGGMMVFPSNRVDGLPSLNQARGFHPRIADRFDLTLECIRRHYTGQASPLTDVMRRYASFFDLFETFGGYVEHFLLQDLVSGDGSVRFFLPGGSFHRSPLPQDIDEYDVYRQRSVEFVRARNSRIDLPRMPITG